MPSRSLQPWNPRKTISCGYLEGDTSYTNRRPYGNEDYLLIYTQGGAGSLVTSSGTCITHPGDATLYVPREMQDYSIHRPTGKWNIFWIHFPPKPHWDVWLNWPVNRQGVRLIHFEGELRNLFRAAFKETIRLSRLQIPEANDLASNALEKALLWAHASGSDKKWRATDPRVREAIDYLIIHFRQPFEMEALARYCGISPSRLSHLFKAETQTSPQKFLERYRIQQACDLLRITRRPIAEIAMEVGYDDSFYFTNRFRRHTGKSPSRFRTES